METILSKPKSTKHDPSDDLEKRVELAQDPMEVMQDLPISELHPEEQQLEFDTETNPPGQNNDVDLPDKGSPDNTFLQTTRSGRTPKPSCTMAEALQQRDQNVIAFPNELFVQAYSVEYELLDPLLYLEEDELVEFDHPITFCYKDPDTMQMHEKKHANLFYTWSRLPNSVQQSQVRVHQVMRPVGGRSAWKEKNFEFV